MRQVEALILDPINATVQVSNVFHFIFGIVKGKKLSADKESDCSTLVPAKQLAAIGPTTLEEARKVLFFENRLASS